MERETMIELGYLPETSSKSRNMSYIVYSRANNHSKTGIPRITISRKGLVTINPELAKIMKISKGSRIVILQSQKDSRDWYLRVSKDEEAFILRQFHGQKSLGFNCSKLCNVIYDLSKIKPEPKTIKFTVSETPIQDDGHELFMVIFSSAKS